MKRSSSAGKLLRRSSGWTALVINLGATPGLGSFVAGHRWVGVAQMTLAVAGFVIFMGWFWKLAQGSWESLETGHPASLPPWRGLVLGLSLFGGAWLWSLATSLRILRDLRTAVPPVLPDPTAAGDPPDRSGSVGPGSAP